MSSFPDRALIAALLALACAAATASQTYPGLGREATPREVAAWDIDVRPDFKGLPRGSGSVARGQQVWDGKCASCHGIFGESNEVFSPLVGGTTQADIASGRVARLTDAGYPGRTTLMKLASVSTLWDYIRRAMPWTQPKSLSTEEVYAVTAYLLNMGGIVADDFVLGDANIAVVQQRLPNRNGMSTEHGLWPGSRLGRAGAPDVKATACMRDCDADTRVASSIPEHARNAHGNLAQQSRLVGAQRGVDTARSAGTALAAVAATGVKPVVAAAAPLHALAQQHACSACHGASQRLVGPAFNEIAARYAGRADGQAYLAAKIKSGGQGVWGGIPMPPQSLSESDAKALAAWLMAEADK